VQGNYFAVLAIGTANLIGSGTLALLFEPGQNPLADFFTFCDEYAVEVWYLPDYCLCRATRRNFPIEKRTHRGCLNKALE